MDVRPLQDLVLDSENPRLVQATPGTRRNERDVIRYLADKEELVELVQSISTNGYLDLEPLIIMKGDGGKFVVLEGNRRVGAMKLLVDPKLHREVVFKVPEVTQQVRESFQTAKALLVASRDDARKYIGFKHINGPHKWDAYAKAKFAADWYDSEKMKPDGLTLRDIAHRLGDRHDTILRLVNGLRVLEQAKREGVYDFADRVNPERPIAFSHLYTALTRPEIREYLGMERSWREAEPVSDSVSPKKKPHLGKLLTWLYGNKETDTAPVVRSQNPDLKRLAEVVAKPEALRVLETSSNLDKAHQEVAPAAQKFSEALVIAYTKMQEAQNLAPHYDVEEKSLMETANKALVVAKAIVATMKSIGDD